ncbi:MAG: hypothetical protein ACRCV7_05020 [Culicoidibacterales bacterium]
MINWLLLMFFFIGTVILIILLIYLIVYYLPSKITTIINAPITEHRKASAKNLPRPKHPTFGASIDFTPLNEYKLLFIAASTTLTEIQILIDEAEKTEKFSCIGYPDECTDAAHICIEFIQPKSSIIIDIKENLHNKPLATKVDELLRIIFSSKKTIYIWGDTESLFFTRFNYENGSSTIIKDYPRVDVQQNFKEWYNNTFQHDNECPQYTDITQNDHLYCTCFHRPYKFKEDRWTLESAIKFTFNQNLDLDGSYQNACLAITKIVAIMKNT